MEDAGPPGPTLSIPALTTCILAVTNNCLTCCFKQRKMHKYVFIFCYCVGDALPKFSHTVLTLPRPEESICIKRLLTNPVSKTNALNA